MKKPSDQDNQARLFRERCDSWASPPDTVLYSLRGEIGFWGEMLKGCDDATPRETVERMRFARDLAERKLTEWMNGRKATTPQHSRPDRASSCNGKIHWLSGESGANHRHVKEGGDS